MNAISCPSYEQLRAYVAGKLDDETSEAISNHLDGCSDCQALIATVDDQDDTLLAKLRRAPAGPAYAEQQAFQEAVRKAKALVGSVVAGKAPAADVPEEAAAGLRQLGEYTLLAKLGEGGMGTVYKALQTKLEKLVAVKILPKSRMEDERAVARFEREMKAIGRLSHPNIVQAFDAREIDGTSVLVMEYVDGVDLSHLVREAGPLLVADACELTRRAALGLQYAHEHALVHRDIKPSNLMLGRDGQVKILDLGLALLGSGQPNGEEMTGSGQAMGTADYMAPEQCCDSHTVDIRADIYSLGCTLYKVLTGHAPFSGPKYPSGLSKMMAHVQERAPSLAAQRPDVPAELAAAVERMMAKSPEDRFQLPADVAAALAPLAAGADLAKLAAKASKMAKPVESRDHSVLSTDPYPSSALAGTKPSSPSPAPTGAWTAAARSAAPPRRYSRWAIAAAAAPLFLIALGVVIWINRTRIEVPEGSGVTINRDGSVAIETSLEGPPVPLTAEAIGASPDVVLTINDGDEVTTSRQVTLSITTEQSDSEPVQMRFCMNGWTEANFTAWEPYQSTKALTLPHWQGKNYVGVQLRDKGGNVKGALDTIVLKTQAEADQPPEVGGQLAKVEPAAITIQPDPDAWKIEPGEPLSDRVLTSKPAAVEGLTSWTVETRGSRGAILDVDRSPDGRLLATACFDGNIRILNASDGSLVSILCGSEGSLRGHAGDNPCAVAWSPDGRFLASGGHAGSVCLWEAATGRLLRKRLSHKGRVVSVGWSADGKHLFSAGSDKCVRVWDSATGRLRFYDTKEEPIATMAISPVGQWVAYSHQNNICLRDAGFKGPVRTLSHEHPVASLTFSADGTLLTSGDEHGIVQIWRTDSGERLHPHLTIEHPKEQNRARTIAALALSPDGHQLASAGGDGNVRLWDVETGLPVSDLPGDRDFVCDLIWTPDGKRLLAACSDGSLQLLDVATRDRSRLVAGRHSQFFNLTHAAWSPDGATLAVSSQARTPASNSALRRLSLWATDLETAAVSPVAADGPQWSPDGEFLIAWNVSDRMQLLEGSTGKFVREFEGSPCRVSFSPSSNLLACSDAYSDDLKVFALPSGEMVQRLKLPRTRTMPVAFSPDGTTFAAVDRGNPVSNEPAKVVLWGIPSWAIPRSFELPALYAKSDYSVKALKWSPDAKKLAVAGQDKCYIIDSQSGGILKVLDSRSHPYTLLWLSDNRTLIVGGTGEVEFWDTDTGAFARPPLKGYWHPNEWMTGLTLSPDHGLLAVGSRWAVLVFDVATGQLHTTLLPLRYDEGIPLGLTGDGCHWRTLPEAEGDIVYVALTTDGQQLTLTPQEFEEKYGWKNDPSKVTLGTIMGPDSPEDKQ